MPDHRGLEPLTQSRAAQTAAYEVTAFSAMDAPFVGISNAGANRFNLVFPGISGEYPLITERAEMVLKIKEMMSTAGWDCLIERKLPDADEHACSAVPLATKPMLTESGGYSKKEVEQRNEAEPVVGASSVRHLSLAA